MKRHVYLGLLATSLCLFASGGCNLLLEDSPKFSASAASTGDGESTTDGDAPDGPPDKPESLEVHTIGDPDDADVEPFGPGVLLTGGGANIDAVFEWQAELINEGDIVVLQGGGKEQLNDYLFSTIGGADSVQTVVLPDQAAAWEPWVRWTIEHAEAVLLVGGRPDQLFWKDTPVEDAIMSAWARGAVIGGIDHGGSVLAEFSFPGAEGPPSSSEALADPYAPDLDLERGYLSIPPLAQVLIEPRFVKNDRMGRLLSFAARVLEDAWSDAFVGLGVDEHTAMVIGPNGVGEVYGDGHVYLFRADQSADLCAPEMDLEFGPVTVYRLAAGDTASWPGGETKVEGMPVSASGGVTDPADPY